MTDVVNLNEYSYDVYIGRGSKWGNPYSHKPSTIAMFKVKNREESIRMYHKWITRGKGKTLGCYCKPKLCHGDILIKLIEKYVKD